MENRNNALHYKMYKSGKSIVYAGLATTAALAGLAFANVNATAVHADTVGTTCPAPNAVSNAQKAASAANSAADIQSDAVVSAQAKVNELTQANKGLKQLSAAQQDYANAESNANSATEQYNKVARPAEKEAQNAFQKATNTTNLSDARSVATKASNDLATNQSKASSVQAEIKTLSDTVVTTSASANQAHENYVANSNAASSALADYYQAIEDGFASDSQKVQDLLTNYNSLNDLANTTAVKSQKAHKEYQDALGKFNNRVKGETVYKQSSINLTVGLSTIKVL